MSRYRSDQKIATSHTSWELGHSSYRSCSEFTFGFRFASRIFRLFCGGRPCLIFKMTTSFSSRGDRQVTNIFRTLYNGTRTSGFGASISFVSLSEWCDAMMRCDAVNRKRNSSNRHAREQQEERRVSIIFSEHEWKRITFLIARAYSDRVAPRW